MGGRRLVVRIVGLASTPRGFAFAVTEGPRRLVKCGLRRMRPSRGSAVASLDKVLRRARPLFIAFDYKSSRRKRHRGRAFADAVTMTSTALGCLLIVIRSEQTRALAEEAHPRKWHVAAAVANMFPEIASKLPPRRRAWQSERERLGIFMALAAAVAAWEAFRGRRR